MSSPSHNSTKSKPQEVLEVADGGLPQIQVPQLISMILSTALARGGATRTQVRC